MKKTSLFILFLGVLFSAKATHNRAGEITYKRITPFTQTVGSTTVEMYNYEIIVTLYTDDGPGVADRCSDTLYFGDGTKAVAYRANGNTSGCLNTSCGSTVPCGTIIYNSPGYVVKKNNYVFYHTYPGPGAYNLFTLDPNRNPGVINIPNSVNIPFYIQSRIIITAGTAGNSSPIFNNPPIGFGYPNICYVHNPGAYDADGDSLSFMVTPCAAPGGSAVPGYMYPTGTFSINPTSGVLNWCKPQGLGEYNVAFIVQEWRKNSSQVYQLIGQVERDMQINVVNGVVGVPENNLALPHVFPNPAHDKISLTELPGNEFTLFSSEGKALLQTKAGVSEIDISMLPAGLYFIRSNYPGSKSTYRFVKQ